MTTLPSELAALVERFARNRDAYHSPAYNETQTRREFIDPLFKALGWDVDNVGGLAEAYKDVIHEDAIKVGGATKAPDYCFRIGGTRKFFVEAKKPAVGIETDPEPAYQLRRYAWTSKLPLSILTDFEEFAVYDCRIRPGPTDSASVARVFYCTYDQYPEKWDWIAGLFSKDAVLKGAFDKYAESNKRKKGTAEVDAEFLKEIEHWREALAQNFALRNLALSTRDLNFAVQRTIDRLVFLRMCEDRGIELYGGLQALLNGDRVYERLAVRFRQADDKYNSGLFYFTREAGREPPDALTLALSLDDKVLKDIIKSLYYPDSPYEFSVLPPEILGQVYEQFLGKVIRLTAGHHAKVEEKPEVRKAGGVYYTPAYIVDYIVKNTVGKFLEAKPPADIAPAVAPAPRGRRRSRGATAVSAVRPRATAVSAVHPLRILDPACGSGSFLLGAYQFLLNWHRDWYVGQSEGSSGSGDQGIEADPASDQSKIQNLKSKIYQGAGGQWLLTIQEKKRILLNHIYGVDIDPQAVETTKLALLLKVLEGESEQTIGSTLRLFHERALPDLDQNIKCGNSLIGPDFYDNQQLTMFDEDERLRINAFDWHAEFPDVFNPPLSQGGAGGGSKPSERATAPPDSGFDAVIGNPPYIDIIGIPPVQRAYFTSRYGTFLYRSDILGVFFERVIGLLRNSGCLGFITSNTYFTSASATKLRHLMLAQLAIQTILDIGGGVFTQANVDTAILIALKAQPGPKHLVALAACASGDEIRNAIFTGASFHRVEQTALGHGPNSEFLVTATPEVGALVDKIGAAGILHVCDIAEFSRGYIAYDAHRGHTQQMIRDRVFHAESRLTARHKKELLGSDIGRYEFRPTSPLWIEFGDNLAAPRDARFHTGPRIWIQRIRNPKLVQRLVCFYTDAHDAYAASSGLTVGRSIDPQCSPRALCALFNSRLVNWWYRRHFHDVNIKPADIVTIPLPTTWTDHQRALGDFADQMQSLRQQLAAAKTPAAQTALQRQIDASDRQIDQLVYQLYGLTDDEIKIVEEATR